MKTKSLETTLPTYCISVYTYTLSVGKCTDKAALCSISVIFKNKCFRKIHFKESIKFSINNGAIRRIDNLLYTRGRIEWFHIWRQYLCKTGNDVILVWILALSIRVPTSVDPWRVAFPKASRGQYCRPNQGSVLRCRAGAWGPRTWNVRYDPEFPIGWGDGEEWRDFRDSVRTRTGQWKWTSCYSKSHSFQSDAGLGVGFQRKKYNICENQILGPLLF